MVYTSIALRSAADGGGGRRPVLQDHGRGATRHAAACQGHAPARSVFMSRSFKFNLVYLFFGANIHLSNLKITRIWNEMDDHLKLLIWLRVTQIRSRVALFHAGRAVLFSIRYTSIYVFKRKKMFTRGFKLNLKKKKYNGRALALKWNDKEEHIFHEIILKAIFFRWRDKVRRSAIPERHLRVHAEATARRWYRPGGQRARHLHYVSAQFWKEALINLRMFFSHRFVLRLALPSFPLNSFISSHC